MRSRNKFYAQKCEYDGHVFDSKKERDRYMILKERERRGEIYDVRCQVRFILLHGQDVVATNGNRVKRRERSYVADFTYRDKQGRFHVEDVKGYKNTTAYQLFTLKTAMMLRVYQIEVEEV